MVHDQIGNEASENSSPTARSATIANQNESTVIGNLSADANPGRDARDCCASSCRKIDEFWDLSAVLESLNGVLSFLDEFPELLLALVI